MIFVLSKLKNSCDFNDGLLLPDASYPYFGYHKWLSVALAPKHALITSFMGNASTRAVI